MKLPALPSILVALLIVLPPVDARAESCPSVVHSLNQRLHPKIDEPELVSILDSLNGSRDAKLPPKFATKRQARKMGWQPGRDLWSVPALRGRSIGGDAFGNREGKLPDGHRRWREADLDYKGGENAARSGWCFRTTAGGW